MSVLRARPPGFAAGINGSRRSHCASANRSADLAQTVSKSPCAPRPHRESKPPSHPGGGESPPNPNRQKLLGQALTATSISCNHNNISEKGRQECSAFVHGRIPATSEKTL